MHHYEFNYSNYAGNHTQDAGLVDSSYCSQTAKFVVSLAREDGPKICEEYIREWWEAGTMQRHERVYAIYLNRKFQIVYTTQICKGSHRETSFDLRETMLNAFNLNADYIIIAHNHPNGSTEPSDADIQITKKIAEAFRMVDLFLVDHLILTQEDCFSFKTAGILPKPGYN